MFGSLLQKVGIARFTRTLGTLIASGVLLPRRLGTLELPPLVDTDVDVAAALDDLRSDR